MPERSEKSRTEVWQNYITNPIQSLIFLFYFFTEIYDDPPDRHSLCRAGGEKPNAASAGSCNTIFLPTVTSVGTFGASLSDKSAIQKRE